MIIKLHYKLGRIKEDTILVPYRLKVISLLVLLQLILTHTLHLILIYLFKAALVICTIPALTEYYHRLLNVGLFSCLQMKSQYSHQSM